MVSEEDMVDRLLVEDKLDMYGWQFEPLIVSPVHVKQQFLVDLDPS